MTAAGSWGRITGVERKREKNLSQEGGKEGRDVVFLRKESTFCPERDGWCHHQQEADEKARRSREGKGSLLKAMRVPDGGRGKWPYYKKAVTGEEEKERGDSRERKIAVDF